MPQLRLNNKQVSYLDQAPAEGAPAKPYPIILIHGLGSSQNYYLTTIPSLRAAGYRCLAPDTTGCARSSYTYIEQSVATLASDILAFMDALDIRKAVVVGHSMAGMTVPQLAATAPDRVAAIVLLGPVYPSRAVLGPFEQRIAGVEAKGMEAMADTVPYAAVGSKAGPLQHAFIREVLMAQQAAGYVSLCRVIMKAGVDQDEGNGLQYGKITCPVLVIVGEEDKSAPVEGAAKVVKEVGTKEDAKKLVVVPGMGHWCAIEDGELCGREILEFLNGTVSDEKCVVNLRL